MKWFHHECAAKHDPKLQTLGAAHGAEGLGIFWGLLEEIGQHSDTFCLKISGISAMADRSFEEIFLDAGKTPPELGKSGIKLGSVPRFPVKILAKILFTTPQKLERVIHAAAEVGLFEKATWLEYGILHSPAFERRADDYTRRVHRRQIPHRAISEHSPDLFGDARIDLPAVSGNVGPEQIQTETEKRKKEQSRSPSSLFPEDVQEHIREFRKVLAEWNQFRVNPFNWNPTASELERLFLGGDEHHKDALCRAWGGSIRFPELVVRALKLMLQASEQRRIANPAGWIWSCLHGNLEGTGPWIQMMRGNGASLGNHSGTPSAARGQ